MLNLESLSIDVPKKVEQEENPAETARKDYMYSSAYATKVTTPLKKVPEATKPAQDKPQVPKVKAKPINPIDLIPKLTQIPQNWNLEDLELKMDMRPNGIKKSNVQIASPDDVGDEWEFV